MVAVATATSAKTLPVKEPVNEVPTMTCPTDYYPLVIVPTEFAEAHQMELMPCTTYFYLFLTMCSGPYAGSYVMVEDAYDVCPEAFEGVQLEAPVCMYIPDICN